MRLVPLQLFRVLHLFHSIVFWLKCHSVSKWTHSRALVLRTCFSEYPCGWWRERDYFHRAMGEVGGHQSLQTVPQVVCGEAICNPLKWRAYSSMTQSARGRWLWDWQHPTLVMALFYFFFTAAQLSPSVLGGEVLTFNTPLRNVMTASSRLKIKWREREKLQTWKSVKRCNRPYGSWLRELRQCRAANTRSWFLIDEFYLEWLQAWIHYSWSQTEDVGCGFFFFSWL